MKYWDGVGPARPTEATTQLEAVIGEVRRLEETATKNEEELQGIQGDSGGPGIRGELDQLKHRLGEIRTEAGMFSSYVVSEMTDIELQKTNTTLRRLSDEMRSYSIERSKEREEELRGEVDRIHSEIKILQRNNEDSATVSDKLSREVSIPHPEIFCCHNNVSRSQIVSRPAEYELEVWLWCEIIIHSLY